MHELQPASPCTLEQHRHEVAQMLAPTLARLTAAGAAEVLSASDPAILGRVLAEEVRALTPIPAFDNSQMDGYAVLAADLASASTEQPVALPFGMVTAAGDAPGTHLAGTASPVMTGAAVPSGADAIVPIEDATPPSFPLLERRVGRQGEWAPGGSTSFVAPVAAGRFVRRAGEDLRMGDAVAASGARITPALIGAFAAAGVSRVRVRPRLRVLLCSTGDELSHDDVTGDSGVLLAPGRIHDANTPMLRAELERLGTQVEVARSRDTPAELRAIIARHATAADLVITSGGISKGAFEVVREALAPLGARFHSVAIQPGGPQGLGLLAFEGAAALPALCLPGNPVSAALSLELFLAPILRELTARAPERATTRLPLAHDVDSPEAKHQIRRGGLDAEGRVIVFAPGSHLIGDLASAELLVHLPVGISHATAGTLVDTWRFND